ncbi:MAG: hypothetical protein QHI48_00840 [Bacteroidota bacterium]|nr:hypothetical protein [Bacteroidota bacterium]
MKRITSVSMAVALLCGFFSGCLNYEQRTILKKDGSGEMEIHYWTKEDNIQFMSNGEFAFQEQDVKNRYTSSGVHIDDIRVETESADSTRHVRVKLSFDNINDLSAVPAFKNTSFSFKKEKGNLVFKQTLKGNTNAGGMGMEAYTFRYIYVMPGEIISSNATRTEDRTLTWEYKLSEMSKDLVLTATVKPASASTTIIIVVAVAAILVVGGVLLFVLRRGKKTSRYDIPPSPGT